MQLKHIFIFALPKVYIEVVGTSLTLKINWTINNFVWISSNHIWGCVIAFVYCAVFCNCCLFCILRLIKL